MFSKAEELDITVDCLSIRIWELKNMLRVAENRAKAFEEQAERVKDETRKLDDLEAKNFVFSKEIKTLDKKIEDLEIKNNTLLKENKILKEKIKELEEKVKTKEKVRNVMKELSKS